MGEYNSVPCSKARSAHRTVESMDVLLANPRGFCAGVDRAIEIVKRAIETLGAPIYVRHEVVHNRFVVDDLKHRGAIFVEELHEVPDGATVIFSAHGVSKAVREEAQHRGLKVFDATCPLVTKVHLEVARHGSLNLMVTGALAWLAEGYLVGGRPSDAIFALEESLSQKRRFDVLRDYGLGLLAEAHLQLGNVVEAERLACQAVEQCRRRHERGWEADSLRVLADTAAHPNRLAPEKAAAGYREALALASELGMLPLVAHCRLGLGNLCRLTGDRSQAREHLAAASEMYDEMDMPSWRGQVAVALRDVT